MTNLNNQQVVINLGEAIIKKSLKKKKRVKKRVKKSIAKKPYTYTPFPNTSQQMFIQPPNLNTIQPHQKQEREIARNWSKLSELQRNVINNKNDADRKLGKFGITSGLINPKGKMLLDSARGRVRVEEMSEGSTQSIDSDEFRKEQYERRRKVVEARKQQRNIRDGRAKVDEKINLSNQVDGNLKEQKLDPQPSRNIPAIHPSLRQRILSKIGLGGSNNRVSPKSDLLTLRSPDYYDGRKSGLNEQKKEMRGQLRDFYTKANSSASNRSQAGIREGLTPVYNSVREGKDDELPAHSGRGRKVGSIRRIPQVPRGERVAERVRYIEEAKGSDSDDDGYGLDL